MFSLVHFLESFEVQEQVQAFIQVMSALVKRAAEWTAILHSRMMNDAITKAAFEERVDFTEDKEMYNIFNPTSFAREAVRLA